MRRPLFAWLLFILLLVVNAAELMASWVHARNQLISITNLAFIRPGSDWWAMAIGQSVLVVIIGLALVWARWYSVIIGVCLFLFFVSLVI